MLGKKENENKGPKLAGEGGKKKKGGGRRREILIFL